MTFFCFFIFWNLMQAFWLETLEISLYSFQNVFFAEIILFGKTFTTFSFKINSAWKGKVKKAQNYKTSILESRNPQKNIPEKDVPEKENFWKVWILKRTFLRRMDPKEDIPEKDESWRGHSWKDWILRMSFLENIRFEQLRPFFWKLFWIKKMIDTCCVFSKLRNSKHS